MPTEEGNYRNLLFYEHGRLRSISRPALRECPIALRINGCDLATLIASPHQLEFLVTGFLRLQGFIERMDDLLSLGICGESGSAEIRIRGEIPARPIPLLTSGCGTGIIFMRPEFGTGRLEKIDAQVNPASIFRLMHELAQRAERYRRHGGIHSAAVGDGQSLLLFAEDIGRHNTLDRLAGEALFKGLDLAGRVLVTSGRVSSEMLAKAVQLGIVLVASRTSATDLAIRMAEQAGLTLVTYVRGETFEICTHPQRLAIPSQPRQGPAE